MQNNILERLLASIQNLEETISQARGTLAAAANAPTDVLSRLESYKGICEMQRRCAHSIGAEIRSGNFQEVTRLVNLINGLSAMILDDVKVVVARVLETPNAQGEQLFN